MDDEIRAQVYHANEWQSDEEGEQEAVTNKYRIHDPNTPWDKMEPKVGDMFESPAQLKFCIQNYGVSNGYQIYFEKCDKTRLVARCGKRTEMNDCPFRLYAGWMYNEKSFQVKNLVGEHRCSRKFKFGSLVSPEWIGRHYITEIANTPKMKLRDMIADIKQRLRCVLSIRQVRRAKKSNPGLTCKVSVTVNPDGKNYFHRFYIGFKALSDGWKLGCRIVIGLDGCFLKGQVKGELLTVIGRDANNQVYPIAWVVVDVENKPNWTWFIELLRDSVDLQDGRGLVVISDQHKGLSEAVKEILPNVEHRQCARHVYANFKKAYTGLEFKKLFWAASMSCVEKLTLIGVMRVKQLRMESLSVSTQSLLMLGKNPLSQCLRRSGYI
ncbi:uncharacterized protein LOC128127496 [Lactuca sativa]|uniref:uncharacterized protein LOC128127496 n=1 Tax=Lactuca sativa TaxID=4236 RepID=UPI0022B012D7|nr:uncharacterized protein LOC128127496 [Lactuca sativa]